MLLCKELYDSSESASTRQDDPEQVAIPESWKGVKVRAAPYKAADPPGWNPPGSLTCVGAAGGALGRQIVPASNHLAPVPSMPAYININQHQIATPPKNKSFGQ